MSSAQVRSGVCREGVKGPMCGLVDLLGDAHEHACWRVFAVQVGCSGSSEHSERKALSGWPAALFLVGPNLGGGASVGLFHGSPSSTIRSNQKQRSEETRLNSSH